MIQNITAEIAARLDKKLKKDSTYLGAMDVDLSRPLQLVFFRNYLIERYRLHGTQCSMFYTMGENEDPDLSERELFEKAGYSVIYEDTGARKTIFDDYDTVEHWRRVGDFKRVFSKFDGLKGDRASDLALSLEELHPRLFDGFASAARVIEQAETSEDLAQAAVSGRRLLEHTADYLFPPQEAELNGREVKAVN